MSQPNDRPGPEASSVPRPTPTALSLTEMAGLEESRRGAGERESLERNERVRRERLRADVRRPGGELLEEAMRLSAFATELRSAPRRARG